MNFKLDRTTARIDAWGLYLSWFVIRPTEPWVGLFIFISASILFLASLFWTDSIDAKEIVILKDKGEK